LNLQSGKIYKVIHKNIDGKQTTAKRIFKWNVVDGLGIERLVFTSKIRGNVEADWNSETETLKLSGKHLPASELLIPTYCVIKIEEAV